MPFDVNGDEDGTPKKLPSIDDVLASIMGPNGEGRPRNDMMMRTGEAQAPTLDAAMRTTPPAVQPAEQKPDMTDQAMRAPAMPGATSEMSKLNDIANVRQDIPSPPMNPSTPALMKEKAAISTPIDRRDPKYKMGTGQRILGTVANFLNGASRNGVAPVEVGPGANNTKYYRDEEARQGKLSGINSQIADQEKLDEMNRQAYQTAAQAQERSDIGRRNVAQAEKYENAIDPKSIHQDKDGNWKGKTYGGKEQDVDEPQYVRSENRKTSEDANTPAPNSRPFQKNDPLLGKPAWFVKSKDGKKDIPFTPKNDEEAMQLGDKGAIARFYYAHRHEGKGSDENNPELNGMSAAEQRDFKAATRQNDLKMKSLMDARRDALLIKPDSVGSIDQQVADLQNERDKIRDGIVARRPKGGKVAAQARENANTVVTPKTKQSVKVGDTVMINNKPHKVTGISKEGKPQVEPQ